ncbi:tail fiber domain-containing protein [bacterium]|jgi:hypothetical protein|nr:tail fiber domain-containing protein [bacterium]MBT4894742.1 tail fiber domain-containing protein [bacterium]MBT7338159.1 tail fiber domain-containing protein [Candidatus Jacksonbacteria bacterium]
MQKTITKTLILAVVLTTALGVNYLFAAWTGPTQTPPAGNTSAPVHVGTTDQVKNGGLSLDALSVFGNGYFQGNVGIGTVSPVQQLQLESVQGQEVGLRLHQPAVRWWDIRIKSNDTSLYFTDVSAGIDRMTIDVSGNVTATSFLYSSDKRLKKNIKSILGLDKILKLQGVSFEWKNNNKSEVGLIAQDVEKIYPELIITDPNTGLKSVKYGNLVAPLIEAIKEQQIQIDNLSVEIEILKSKIEDSTK